MNALAISLAKLLSVATLVLVLFLLPGSRRKGGEIKVCGTPGCVEHAQALGLDTSRSPSACDVFSAFTCPGWKIGDEDVVTTVSQAILLWIISLQKMSLDAYEREAVVNRPLSMMRECMHRSCDDADAVMSLLELVNRTNFAWPTLEDEHGPPITDYSRPLRLILELSVLWAVPLWFRVWVLPAESPLQRRRAIVLSPSTLPAIWRGLHETLLLYEDAYSIYLSYFNASIFRYRPPSESFAFFLRTGASVQTQVLSHLSSAFQDTYKQPRLVEIRSLPTWIRKVGAEEWVKPFGSVFGTQQNITVAVRLYRALVEILFPRNIYEQDAALALTDETLQHLDELLSCFEKDLRVLPAGQRCPASVDSAKFRGALLQHAATVMLGFRAYRDHLTVRLVWQVDFRFKGLPEFSSDALFFLYYALDNCESADTVYAEHQGTWMHARYRVNAAQRHVQEFAEQFGCRDGDQMALSAQMCHVLKKD
ncbi:hypothetical protein V5799_017070 [Amblyomma americanum]|uniref:Peptidase M13 C-terminal domain-containing protein n=1 Tax=Amblyomma americanum TaxID=6943 RepID=A0AAQ4F350_AMBAM